MAANIGGESVDLISATAAALKPVVEKEHRFGFDGYSLRTVGAAQGEFHARTSRYFYGDTPANNAAAAKTHLAACAALQGTIVEMEDDWGTTISNVLVERVMDGRAQLKRVVYNGDSGAVRVELEWDLVKVA